MQRAVFDTAAGESFRNLLILGPSADRQQEVPEGLGSRISLPGPERVIFGFRDDDDVKQVALSHADLRGKVVYLVSLPLTTLSTELSLAEAMKTIAGVRMFIAFAHRPIFTTSSRAAILGSAVDHYIVADMPIDGVEHLRRCPKLRCLFPDRRREEPDYTKAPIVSHRKKPTIPESATLAA